ncbi:threonine synthase [bacterium]|nr:threonine synthase [bacterium]
MSTKRYFFKCVKCGKEIHEKENILTCPECDSNMDVIYDYESIDLKESNDFDMFLFPQLLPNDADKSLLRVKIGGTPLVKSRNKETLFFKDDSRNPSLSFKDRASAIGVLKTIELKRKGIVTASTGNAAASLATLSALAGIKAVIFAPVSAPQAKLAQIQIHGAFLVKVNGSYDEAFDIATEFSQKSGYYLRNTGINPMMTEGKKTVAFEIAKQFDYDLPENIFVSVGDGCIIGSVYKGFYELKKLNKIERIPRIFGIQAHGANPIFQAFKGNYDKIDPIRSSTIADSINVGNPRDYQKALRAVIESHGEFIEVEDREIMAAQSILAKDEGIYAEPAASAAFAGYLKKGIKGRTVVLITGNGLKDINATIKSNEFASLTVSPTDYNIDYIMEKVNNEV